MNILPEYERSMSADSSPKIVIVDESPIRAAILEEGLREAGFKDVVHISEMQSLLARIYALDPDVIVIDLENPSRDVLEQMFQVSRAVRRPIAMFVDQSDAASIQASVDAGVSAYIVDGLKKERLKPILDLCISRFNAFSRLQDELDRAKSALEDRKVIDRAKGILMKLKGLTEEEAYVLLRSTAMREKKKIGEIAPSILTASELLKGRPRCTLASFRWSMPRRSSSPSTRVLRPRKGSMSPWCGKCRGRMSATSSTSACSRPRHCWPRSRSPQASGSGTSRCRSPRPSISASTATRLRYLRRCMRRSWAN